jgi:hypothetical protein
VLTTSAFASRARVALTAPRRSALTTATTTVCACRARARASRAGKVKLAVHQSVLVTALESVNALHLLPANVPKVTVDMNVLRLSASARSMVSAMRMVCVSVLSAGLETSV